MPIEENHPTDGVEPGRRRGQRRRRRMRRPPVARSSGTTTDESLRFSDSDSDHSWHSPLGSTAGGSFDEMPHSDCLSDGIDLENGDMELKVHSALKEHKDCRICHLKLVGGSGDNESGAAIELGCSCKGDLAAAHKQCAETWFKIRGNTTCEICGATALNVVGEQTNEANGATATATAATTSAPTGPLSLAETQNYWHGRRLMNILLGCMVFAFIISWLFHFNLLSHHHTRQ